MININLLPKNLRRSTGPDGWRIAAGTVAAVALVTMGVLQYSVQNRLNGINKDIAEAQSELAVRANDVRERNELQARKTELQAVAGVAQTLESGRTSWSADLARFVRQLPTSNTPIIALTNVSMRMPQLAAAPGGANAPYDGKAVTKELVLSGLARSSDALVRLVNTFENAPEFGVQFQNAARDPNTGEYTFAVTVGMIGDKPKPALTAAASENGAVGTTESSASGTTTSGTTAPSAPPAPSTSSPNSNGGNP
ncbi:flagellar protein FliT [Deinococcus yavapaiensis]|uniref:Type IV pilus assembly protein PilN n=1 Tax=Deinococcus yavapaiensis KR-236 TaxID=694435 RepID=A0A318SCN0_9DEIO|nr:flagellar protein FliT [Deinococcus yavapaiensis]PYE56383.1 type IV pilus assembly protein PilN [Deinococcus yavapaiensis KR-236]